METEILRKFQQQCESWRETKESYLKGDWQTTTFCYVLCSLYLFVMRWRFSSGSGAIPAKFYFFSNCISDPERQQKYLSTVCRVEGLTVYDYNFFTGIATSKAKSTFSPDLQYNASKKSVMKEIEKKKKHNDSWHCNPPLDNQARPIYPLVDLSSSTIIILVTIIKYALLYCTWPKLFVFPLIISIA